MREVESFDESQRRTIYIDFYYVTRRMNTPIDETMSALNTPKKTRKDMDFIGVSSFKVRNRFWQQRNTPDPPMFKQPRIPW